MNTFFRSLGHFDVRFRYLIVLVWALLLVMGAILAPRLQEVFEREVVTGGTGEAQQAADVVAEEFTARSAYQQLLVFRSSSRSVDDPEYQAAAERVIAAAESTGRITSTDSYYSTDDESLVSEDRRTTYAILNLRSKTHTDGMVSSGKIIDEVEAVPKPPWLEAYVTGEEAASADLADISQESVMNAERVGLPVALLVLVLVFGALVAAGIPLLMGVVTIVITLGLAFLIGQKIDLSIFVENVATMLGLGVGIDYSLFILNRFRSEMAAGRSKAEAVLETVTHAGRAVSFSGFAVAIGLSALFATGQPIVISVAIGGIVAVFVAVAAALTLLPAILMFLGSLIEAPRAVTRLLMRAHRTGFWERWAREVMRRPIIYVGAGVVVIAAIASPATVIRTGSLGVALLGEDAQSRKGFDILTEEFGAGRMSPVQIIVTSERGVGDQNAIAGIYALTQAIEKDGRFAGVVSLTSLVPGWRLDQYQELYGDNFSRVPEEFRGRLGQLVNLEAGADTTVMLALLHGDPSSSESEELVDDLRFQIIPSLPELEGLDVLVGGSTALHLDMTRALYARFPVAVAIVLAATFVLLTVLFRSVVLPLKAVVMNLLSVAAAYGLLVLVFQHGLGDRLLGFEAAGFVNWVTPVIVFCMLFGLSMDYEVFLLSRVRELHDRGLSNEDSIATGLERTGGVITGAAMIMIVIFAAFTLSPIIFIKEIGFALAVAVLLDATLIRVVLVPATMRLLGNSIWWLPGFLDRLLPRPDLEPDIGTGP
ncbi:MAG: MMPL family transporter [Dehalococcoidia bacterium]